MSGEFEARFGGPRPLESGCGPQLPSARRYSNVIRFRFFRACFKYPPGRLRLQWRHAMAKLSIELLPPAAIGTM
jgi:hypothetical protein